MLQHVKRLWKSKKRAMTINVRSIQNGLNGPHVPQIVEVEPSHTFGNVSWMVNRPKKMSVRVTRRSKCLVMRMLNAQCGRNGILGETAVSLAAKEHVKEDENVPGPLTLMVN